MLEMDFAGQIQKGLSKRNYIISFKSVSHKQYMCSTPQNCNKLGPRPSFDIISTPLEKKNKQIQRHHQHRMKTHK